MLVGEGKAELSARGQFGVRAGRESSLGALGVFGVSWTHSLRETQCHPPFPPPRPESWDSGGINERLRE